MFLCHDARMSERQDRPVSRAEMRFVIEMALFKARRLWPRSRVPGDHDRLKPMARAVVDHIELCGMRWIGRTAGNGPSTSDLVEGSPGKGPEGGDGD